MIDLKTEKSFTLRAATKLPELQRNGKSVSLPALYRWASSGIRGVRLETVRQGASTVTTREAIERFFAALSSAPGEPETARTPLRRQRDHERAEQQLAASGW